MEVERHASQFSEHLKSDMNYLTRARSAKSST
jgi:hypothetical protein